MFIVYQQISSKFPKGVAHTCMCRWRRKGIHIRTERNIRDYALHNNKKPLLPVLFRLFANVCQGLLCAEC